VSDVTYTASGEPPKVGEWHYSLHLSAGLDSGPRIVAKHYVVRELPSGEMEQKGPYVSQGSAENIALALNIALRMAGQLG
jgi:hypothetical protein